MDTQDPPSFTKSDSVELSVVMPCLNEADTVAVCVEKALRAMKSADIAGEVIVADNGSTDGSCEIAAKLGARVVDVEAKGYGSALMGGIAAASGKYVLMGDADDSYDFLELPGFVEKLRQGFDLVQGCRLPSGGGVVAEGAMPWSHRWLGNPVFSLLVRIWFHAPIHDVYCGMRGFSKAMYERLGQRCTGMEFATEMIIKASLSGEKIAEVPITLHKDGRVAHPPHLKTVRDGWRTLRFFLMCTPRWLFLVPGCALMLAGLLGFALALPGIHIGRATLDAHTLLFSSLFLLCGYQGAVFALLAKTFAVSEGILPADRRLDRFYSILSVESLLAIGTAMGLVGCGILLMVLFGWCQSDFGPLDYSKTMRWVIPGATAAALGFQTLLGAFFVSILFLRRC